MGKTIDFKPGRMTMDARSNPGDLDLKEFRYVLNWRLKTKERLCRSPGFDKAFTTEDYNNQDLRDQLLSLTGMEEREPITFLFEAISTRKTTKLIAGTSRVLFALNSGIGNYKVISDQYGTASTRWRAAQLEDIVLFSNNLDALVYWHFDQGITEAGNQSVAPVPQLVDLEITRAGVVIEWKGHIFLMNVTVSGQVRGHTIYWCNYNNPLDWLPSDASTAGNVDLDSDETILGALELGNRLLVYTNKNIWEGLATGDEEAFTFAKRYATDNRENCLFYPRTLISKGDQHVFAGKDGIYVYSLFMDKPNRTEWIHKASSIMFDSINETLCETHVAAFDSIRKELIFSYATGDNEIPNKSLILNAEYPFASEYDHGFSAMCMFTSKGTEILIRDFLREQCICQDEDLGFTEEGGFCAGEGESEPLTTTDDDPLTMTDDTPLTTTGSGASEEPVSCPDPPTSIYTIASRTETYGAESIDVEDWDEATADPDSLCAQLEDITLQEFCAGESGSDTCNSGTRFLAASSTDYCIKEFSDNFYREICIDFDGCGEYELTGYKSKVRSGPISAGESKHEKRFVRFGLEADHVSQVTPSVFRLRIGQHAQAVDPNNDQCGIIWQYQDNKNIDCIGGNAASHATNATRPSEPYEWPLFYENGYLYYELSVENPAADPIDTGGECCLARISVDLGIVKRRRF